MNIKIGILNVPKHDNKYDLIHLVTLSASPHRVAVLAKCPPPDTVRGLRSFIGAYKVLSRVLPNCSAHTSPLENAIAGYQFQDKIVWIDDL